MSGQLANQWSLSVLITTIARPTLPRMLESLVGQLLPCDYLDIAVDGPEYHQAVRQIMEGFNDRWQCTVKVHEHPVHVGNWGHDLRNCYQMQLQGDYVMHGDDDDIYPPGAFDIVRSHIKEAGQLYIFQMYRPFLPDHGKLIPKCDLITADNIGSPNGVIANRPELFGRWINNYNGDFQFWKATADNIGQSNVHFVHEIIYHVIGLNGTLNYPPYAQHQYPVPIHKALYGVSVTRAIDVTAQLNSVQGLIPLHGIQYLVGDPYIGCRKKLMIFASGTPAAIPATIYDEYDGKLTCQRQIYLVCLNRDINLLSDYIGSFVWQGSMTVGIRQVTYDADAASEGDIPIDPNCLYLCCRLIPDTLVKTISAKNLYLISTEQLSRPGLKDQVTDYLNQGITIFNYSEYHCTILPSPRHHYLPYQITSQENSYLTQLVINQPKIYDVVMCSHSPDSSRRQTLLQQLIQKGVNAVEIGGWGMTRDIAIAQGKILLNVHYDDSYQIFEHFRCDRWALAGMLVITQSSLNDATLDIRNLLIIRPYEELVDKVMKVLHRYDHYRKKIHKNLMELKTTIINNRAEQLNTILPLICGGN